MDEGRKPWAGPYGNEPESTERSRSVYIPYGMTIADGSRSVGGFTEEELADPSLKTIVHCA
jgi:hypothetical protein